MDELDVALVQALSSLEPAENRAAMEAAIADLDVDLVVLPEAFARDFGSPGDDVSEFAEPTDGPFGRALTDLATPRRSVVAGMFEASTDPARPWNTLLLRGAATADYRKIHLYDSFGYKESDRLLAGEWEPVVVEVGGFRVGLMTCYDLRFPELARDLVDAGAEVLVVPSAWVHGRTEAEHATKVNHWRTLVRARAIENTAYVVAVGQPVPRYTGRSLVVDPMGEVVAEAGEGPEVLRATLRRDAIDTARSANPALANRRRRGR